MYVATRAVVYDPDAGEYLPLDPERLAGVSARLHGAFRTEVFGPLVAAVSGRSLLGDVVGIDGTSVILTAPVVASIADAFDAADLAAASADARWSRETLEDAQELHRLLRLCREVGGALRTERSLTRFR
ncbi:MAG: hypothetical protein ABIZ50_01100 [Solirubrobacterales bacterium]